MESSAIRAVGMGKQKQDAPKQDSFGRHEIVWGGKVSMTTLCLVSNCKATVDIIYILTLENNI